MNIQITKEEKELLLKRRVLSGKIGYETKTPGRLDIRKELAKKLNVKEELVIIKRVKPDYGSQSAHLEARVYEDEKTLKDVEFNHMLARHGLVLVEKKEEKEAPKKEEKEEKKE